MLPAEVTARIHYLLSDNSSIFQPNYNMLQNNIPAHYLSNGFVSNNIPDMQMNLQSSSLSTNSTSDEAEDQNHSIIDERKQRRMISNRESARRSRMRKQKHLDELWSQVVRLRNENHNLMEKLNNSNESQDRVLKENVRLKQETTDLRQMLTTLQIGSPYNAMILRDLDEVHCHSERLIVDSSSQSVSSSVDLLR